MRCRPSARLLLLDESGHVLLFRYAYAMDELEGPSYWSTPGGGLEAGETFEQAARRELWEETGLAVEDMGMPVAEREFVLQLVTGETVLAQERYFTLRVTRQELSDAGWTELERKVMLESRWWSHDDLLQAKEAIFPENLISLIQKPGPPAED